jgi:hypothetical protein
LIPASNELERATLTVEGSSVDVSIAGLYHPSINGESTP